MRRKRLSKAVSALLTIAIFATSSISAFAASKVDISFDNDNNPTRVTATRKDGTTDRMALAQFDSYGKLINFTVGNATTVTNDYSYDPTYKTKIMSFSDFETATAVEDARILGSKTKFYWDGKEKMGTLQQYTYDTSRGATLTYYDNGNAGDPVLTATNDDYTANDSTAGKYYDSPGWMHLDAGNITSDWTVFEWDVKFNSDKGADDAHGHTVVNFNLNNGVTTGTPGTNSYNVANFTVGRTGSFINYKYPTRVSFLGGSESTIETNHNYHMALVVNHRDRMIELFVDGTSKGTVDLSGTNFEMKALRIGYGRHYDLTLDNLKVYEGAKVRNNVTAEEVREIVLSGASIVETKNPDRYNDATFESALSGKKAFHASTGVVWDGTKKIMLENTPYENASGVRMVPKNELATALGVSAGSTSGQETRNGVAYVPVTSFLSGKTYTQLSQASDNANMYVLASGFSASNVDLMNDWMMYYRPSADEVLSSYRDSARAYQHPRLLATQSDFDALRAKYQSGTADATWMKYANWVIEYADGRIGAYIPKYEAYDAAGRMNYQRISAGDFYSLGLAYQLTGDSKYAEQAWTEVEAICGFKDFNMGHILDAGEAMAGVAIAYDWFYNYWTPERRQMIEKCLHDNGLYYAWEGYETTSKMANELTSTNNHGTVCNTGAMMAAVATMDVYPEISSWIVSEALKCMELNIDKWDTELWYEGPGYHELTMQFTAKWIDVLEGVFPGGYGFGGLEGIQNASTAEAMLHTPTGTFTFGDSMANGTKFWVPEMIWTGNRYWNAGIPALVAAQGYPYMTTPTYQGEDTALLALWYNENNSSLGNMELDYINTKLDVATFRSSHTTSTTDDYSFVGIKGGTANETHAHLDAGQFFFEADGVRWADDIGMGSYVSTYEDYKLGEEGAGTRWLHMAARAENHNLLIVNPSSTTADIKKLGRAELTVKKNIQSGAIATMDMTSVLNDVSKATRGYYFTDQRRSLAVRDEITTTSGTGKKLYWTMIIPEGTTMSQSGSVITLTAANGETLKVEYQVEGASVGTVKFEGSNMTPISSSGLYDTGVYKLGKLQLPLTSTSTSVNVTVKLTPGSVTNGAALSSFAKPIAQWQ